MKLKIFFTFLFGIGVYSNCHAQTETFIISESKFKGYKWFGTTAITQGNEPNSILTVNLYLLGVIDDLNEEDTTTFEIFSKYGVGYNYADTFYYNSDASLYESRKVTDDTILFVSQINQINQFNDFDFFTISSPSLYYRDHNISCYKSYSPSIDIQKHFAISNKAIGHENLQFYSKEFANLPIAENANLYYDLLGEKLLYATNMDSTVNLSYYIKYASDYNNFRLNEFELKRRKEQLEPFIQRYITNSTFKLGPFTIFNNTKCSDFDFAGSSFYLREFGNYGAWGVRNSGYNISKTSELNDGVKRIYAVNALDFFKLTVSEQEAEKILSFTTHNSMYGRNLKFRLEYIILPHANMTFHSGVNDPFNDKGYEIKSFNAYITKVDLLEDATNKVIYTMLPKTKIFLNNFYKKN